MEAASKRPAKPSESLSEGPLPKSVKTNQQESNSRFAHLRHGKGRSIPRQVLNRLTDEDVELLEGVKTSCTDLERIRAAIKLRMKHRLCIRLPEDDDDSTYYIENGLRKVYPYQYLYQSYAKRRWIGRKLKDVMKEEFRDISDEQLKWRFDCMRVLINGDPAKFDHIVRDNNFITNRNHRHELPVLATPIRFIHQSKDTLVIDKPPSIPIHPCGRYRHNSVINILSKEYNMKDIKVVHRLDRLVSGVLIIALNSGRANVLETMIKNRDVQKEYVCRVSGEFPIGSAEDDGNIIVDQPLDTVPGKIGITVVTPEGKPSVTKFKRLAYNGKTSAVLCKPLTGRMHQIRVHLQYLGHPIVNDGLYNCTAFGPGRGKGGKYGKSLRQLSDDVLQLHRASTWLVTENNDILGCPDNEEPLEEGETNVKIAEFVSESERKETMAALAHYFTNQSWKDLEQRWKFDLEKVVKDETCRDCSDKFHDPPLRSLFLYLHALRYRGADWCYESEMPVWARESWQD